MKGFRFDNNVPPAYRSAAQKSVCSNNDGTVEIYWRGFMKENTRMTMGKNIKVKAILLGVLTDVAGSTVTGIVIGIGLGIALAAQHVPTNEIAIRLHGASVLISSLILGFGFTVLGGYVAGRVAKQSEILHGGIVGAIGILFSLFTISYPLWYNIVAIIGIVPFGIIGGLLARKRHK